MLMSYSARLSTDVAGATVGVSLVGTCTAMGAHNSTQALTSATPFLVQRDGSRCGALIGLDRCFSSYYQRMFMGAQDVPC